MPKIIFLPQNISIEVDVNSKVLTSALQHKIPIRYGCGSCRCGTCAVAVSGDAVLTPMDSDEKTLLKKCRVKTNGQFRLSCKARIQSGECIVDLNFQDEYSP